MTVEVDLSQYDQVEHAHYYTQLGKLWEHARIHLGEDIHKRIVTFLFRENFLEETQRQWPSMGEFPLLPGKALNAARLRNEDIVPFPPFPAPEIPGSMKVSLTVIE